MIGWRQSATEKAKANLHTIGREKLRTKDKIDQINTDIQRLTLCREKTLSEQEDYSVELSIRKLRNELERLNKTLNLYECQETRTSVLLQSTDMTDMLRTNVQLQEHMARRSSPLVVADLRQRRQIAEEQVRTSTDLVEEDLLEDSSLGLSEIEELRIKRAAHQRAQERDMRRLGLHTIPPSDHAAPQPSSSHQHPPPPSSPPPSVLAFPSIPETPLYLDQDALLLRYKALTN